MKQYERPTEDNTAYALGPGQIVGCYICMQSQSTADNQFKRGEAFLVGPGRYGNNAHYICKDHLDKDLPFFDPYAE